MPSPVHTAVSGAGSHVRPGGRRHAQVDNLWTRWSASRGRRRYPQPEFVDQLLLDANPAWSEPIGMRWPLPMYGRPWVRKGAIFAPPGAPDPRQPFSAARSAASRSSPFHAGASTPAARCRRSRRLVQRRVLRPASISRQILDHAAPWPRSREL